MKYLKFLNKKTFLETYNCYLWLHFLGPTMIIIGIIGLILGNIRFDFGQNHVVDQVLNVIFNILMMISKSLQDMLIFSILFGVIFIIMARKIKQFEIENCDGLINWKKSVDQTQKIKKSLKVQNPIMHVKNNNGEIKNMRDPVKATYNYVIGLSRIEFTDHEVRFVINRPRDIQAVKMIKDNEPLIENAISSLNKDYSFSRMYEKDNMFVLDGTKH